MLTNNDIKFEVISAFYHNRLSNQQYKTLMGQIKSGNAEGAVKGLQKILKRNNKKGLMKND